VCLYFELRGDGQSTQLDEFVSGKRRGWGVGGQRRYGIFQTGKGIKVQMPGVWNHLRFLNAKFV
jgi:hypothetical protein